jgi:hypothetical protein
MSLLTTNRLFNHNKYLFIIFCGLLVIPASAFAAETPNPPAPISRDALMEIGRAFAKKIGNKLEQADLLLHGGSKLKLSELRSNTSIPEGEPLIMQSFIGVRRLPLGHEVYAIRKNDRLMISFGEFCQAADFAITVSPEKGLASGWFIRENQLFYLDTGKGEVAVAGKTEKIDPLDVSVSADDLLISSALVEKWFGLNIDIDLPSLALNITSSQPLPVEERENRRLHPEYMAYTGTQPKLPLRAEPYHILTRPNLDVSVSTTLSRTRSDLPLQDSSTWSVVGGNDLLGLSSQTFVNGVTSSSGKAPLVNSLRERLGRLDPDGKLLGPIHAKDVEVGDVYTVNVPLVGGATQEQGVYVSSLLPGAPISLNQIDVRGDAQPGWDVELYRNDSLVGFEQVTPDGQYNFQSVFLFAGDNNLHLVFYGPQGEIREETRHIVAAANGPDAGKGAWSVSLSRAGITTYDANLLESPVRGTPGFVAQYIYGLGNLGSATFGVAHRTETDGKVAARKEYFQSGLATNILGTLLTTDVALETGGGYMSSLTARRNFDKHQMGMTFQHASDQFTQGTLGGGALKDNFQFLMRGPITDTFMDFRKLGYSFKSNYKNFSNGDTLEQAIGSVDAGYGNIGLGTGLQYNTFKSGNPLASNLFFSGDPASVGKLSGFTSARGFLDKGRWRVSSIYGFNPFTFSTFIGNYTYPFSKEFEGLVDVEDRLNPKEFRSLRLSANWHTDKMTLSPYIYTATDLQMALGVSMNFGLAANPNTGRYAMTSRSVSDSGSVGARVFMDTNGDGVYEQGEELLPDAEVKAPQTNASAITNGKGVAFLPGLQRGRKTDITLNAGALPDVYYMSMEEGASIIPRPGVSTQFDFPIVVGGGLDGQSQYRMSDNTVRVGRNFKISLVAPDGKLEKETLAAYDGYWSIDTIRPGVYYLVAEPDQNGLPGNVLPRLVEFKPGGTTLFGQNITLEQGYNIPFLFRSDNAPPSGKRRTRVIKPDDIASTEAFINLGDFRSRLGLALAWYKFRMRSTPWNTYFTLATPLKEIMPDPKTALMTLTLRAAGPVTPGTAASICRTLQGAGFVCSVTVVTHYKDLVPRVEEAERSAKKDKS